MEMFIWNMAISFQLLFIIISSVIFIYLREKSFKYYALYNIFLIIYLLSRYDSVYYGFENLLAGFIGTTNSKVFTEILNFFIQVIFYNLYSMFALYFLDLDKRVKKYFNKVVLTLRILGGLFFLFAVLSYVLKNSDLYILLYTFIYLPVMLTLFLISVVQSVNRSGKHKDFFLFGVTSYICCALIAFTGTFIPSLNIKNPISFFYVGIIIETIFFSLGLAYKIKIINDEKNRVRNLITIHKHEQEISKLEGLMEGEENERKRIAEELHDGIAGDLLAIKFNLSNINAATESPVNVGVLKEVSQIIDNSCVQIREISHNLSPSSITNFGLLQTVENLCKKVESVYKIKVNFNFSGDEININKNVETHIYRIIQELVNNVVKHSQASIADVSINYKKPQITISVQDNGRGFSEEQTSNGIGLSNIDSRIRFLNAKIKKDSHKHGTLFTISINLDDIYKT